MLRQSKILKAFPSVTQGIPSPIVLISLAFAALGGIEYAYPSAFVVYKRLRNLYGVIPVIGQKIAGCLPRKAVARLILHYLAAAPVAGSSG